jgi:hypothetical protein
MEHAMATSMLKPGHSRFLGALQKATTTLWAAEDDKAKEGFTKKANEWSTDAPPKHIQSRYCHTHSFSNLSFTYVLNQRMATTMRKRIIQDFQSQLYKTCGVRSLVLTAYEGEDHDLKVGM